MHLIWSPSTLDCGCSLQRADHVAKDELTKQQMLSHISNMIDATKYCIHCLSYSYISSPRNVCLTVLSKVSASVSLLDSGSGRKHVKFSVVQA